MNGTKYASNFHSQIPFETAVKTDKRAYVSEHDDAPSPENRNKRPLLKLGEPSGKSPAGLSSGRQVENNIGTSKKQKNRH